MPLPIKSDVTPLGELITSTVKRFETLECSLRAKSQLEQFLGVVHEYFYLGHVEPIPQADLKKALQEVFYLPMHAMRKESSTTIKLRVVFDTSAKTKSGTSLNDVLLVGPTVHSPLLDVLMKFRHHRVAMTTEISKMYRAVLLQGNQRDLHRFVWKEEFQIASRQLSYDETDLWCVGFLICRQHDDAAKRN